MTLYTIACVGAAFISKDPDLAFQPPGSFASTVPSGEAFGDSRTSHCPTLHLCVSQAMLGSCLHASMPVLLDCKHECGD
jgi:hypothetical protein